MNASLHLRRVMAVLLLATAVVFVAGVVVERRDENHAERTEQSEAAEHSEGPEAELNGESAAHRQAEKGNEARVLGIDSESTPLVVLAVLISIALAVLLWRSESEILLGLVAIVAAVFAIFDVAEVFHQIDESRNGLATMAALVAAGHAAIAILSTTALLRARRTADLNTP